MSASTQAPVCIFCKIVAGDLPAEIIHMSDLSVAFRDLHPQAPTHVLVVPRSHQENAAATAENDPLALVDLFTTAHAVAEAEGLVGYRAVLNTGAVAQQSVFHTHLHVIGGRNLSWPPG